MTFEQAKKKKAEYGKTFMSEGKLYLVKIVPTNEDDYIKYLSDLKADSISDEESEEYSSDGDFNVVGLMNGAFENKINVV